MKTLHWDAISPIPAPPFAWSLKALAGGPLRHLPGTCSHDEEAFPPEGGPKHP